MNENKKRIDELHQQISEIGQEVNRICQEEDEGIALYFMMVSDTGEGEEEQIQLKLTSNIVGNSFLLSSGLKHDDNFEKVKEFAKKKDIKKSLETLERLFGGMKNEN